MLKLGKDVNWPLFKNLVADDGMVHISLQFAYSSYSKMQSRILLQLLNIFVMSSKKLCFFFPQKKLPDIMSGNISSISMDIINNLGEALSLKPEERRIELIESSCNFKLSEVLESCSNINLTEQERNNLQVCHYFVVKNFHSSLVYNYYSCLVFANVRGSYICYIIFF